MGMGAGEYAGGGPTGCSGGPGGVSARYNGGAVCPILTVGAPPCGGEEAGSGVHMGDTGAMGDVGAAPAGGPSGAGPVANMPGAMGVAKGEDAAPEGVSIEDDATSGGEVASALEV